MNAYLVRIPGVRLWTTPILDDGSGPAEPYQPLGIFIAGRRAAAKHDALRAWSQSPSSGVYADDWNALRVTLLETDVEFLEPRIRRGELHAADCSTDTWERLWRRVDAALAEVAG